MPDDDCYKKRNTYRLSPKRTYLPFFAYDVFKPGEVAFSRICDFIDEEKTVWEYGVEHPLDILNGVPFLFKNRSEYYRTRGSLIYFNNDDAYDAYKIISDAKSKKLYSWDTIFDGNVKMNVLVGRNDILKVQYHENRGEYYGAKDPMIIDVIYAIWDNIYPILSCNNSKFDFFNLQMNYAMLWSAIDRYLVLRYGKKDQQENLELLAEEKSFKKAVLQFADKNNRSPEVFSNEDFRHFKLDKNKPLCCIRYYYTIRCNVIHTGKSQYDDYGLLKYAFLELLKIYMYLIRDSFGNFNLFGDIYDEIVNFEIC